MALQAIRGGLTYTIPVLLIGSFCLIILNLPIPPYQEFLAQLPLLTMALRAVYQVTMGVFSLYVAVCISVSYAQCYLSRYGDFFTLGAPFASVATYLVLVGMGDPAFSIAVLSTRSLFIAIIAGLGASAIYCAIQRRQRRIGKFYGNSIDSAFNKTVTSVIPIALVLLVAAAINTAVATLFGVTSLEELFYHGISSFFPADTSSLGSGLLYIFLNNFMWFFGIHGGNMLDGVAQSVFLPGTAENAALVAAGLAPTQIVTKTFMDVFVSVGGAGALLSLLLAILVFGKRRNMRRLSALAAAPMLFNVSEIMLFGLPVIWNPLLLVPFIVVPMINLAVSYAATAVGLVPYVTFDVSWTTPPIIGGFLSTGSVSGAVLQVVNILVGMAVYLPFMRMYERSLDQADRQEYTQLVSRFQTSESDHSRLALTAIPGTSGLLARMLTDDLRRALDEGSFDLYYQPQYNIHDKGIGAEALLRWRHPVYGMLYPPLVIKLADEAALLDELEQAVVLRVLDDAVAVQGLAREGRIGKDFALSVNATARTLQEEPFVNETIRRFKERGLDPGRVVVEATEHEALSMSVDMTDLLDRFVNAGIPLAIDDFSMGHTSFKYLETSAFTVVKLDGSIAKGVMGNSRFADIVASITKLSDQLGFKVLAEYVETKVQRDALEQLGCEFFQGYLYSPAVPLDEMLRLVQSSEDKNRT